MEKKVSTKFSEFSFLVQRFFGLVQNFVLIQNRLTQTFVLQHKRKTNAQRAIAVGKGLLPYIYTGKQRAGAVSKGLLP